jgi:hypothetical protein
LKAALPLNVMVFAISCVQTAPPVVVPPSAAGLHRAFIRIRELISCVPEGIGGVLMRRQGIG